MNDQTLPVHGAELNTEEAAALVAVLAKLSAAEPETNEDAGSTGPADRTVQRRHRLQASRHGLWGRPGPTSWYRAAGGTR